MAAAQRKLLEQLMGANVMTSSGAQATQFTDPKVCRSFLVGDCPHDMFVATKIDLGLCPRIHSEQLKHDYQVASREREYGYEVDYARDLARYVEECNRKVEDAQKRLERSAEDVAQSNALMGEIANLEELMHLTLQEVQVYGELELVSRAIDEYYTVDKLRIDKESREQDLQKLNSGSGDPQKLQVCDVCGAYLSKLDNDRRLADHFGGKLHQGYFRMRAAAEANNKVIEQKKAAGIQMPQSSQQGGGGRRDEDDRGYDYGGRHRDRDRDGRDNRGYGGYGARGRDDRNRSRRY